MKKKIARSCIIFHKTLSNYCNTDEVLEKQALEQLPLSITYCNSPQLTSHNDANCIEPKSSHHNHKLLHYSRLPPTVLHIHQQFSLPFDILSLSSRFLRGKK